MSDLAVEPPPDQTDGPPPDPAEPVPPPPVDAPRTGRRRPSTIGGLAYLLVFAAEVAGLLIVAFGPWRDGVSLMGGALVAASLTRAALPRREAGMLGVRGKWFDVVVLVLVGVALMALAQNIPSQP